MTAQWMAPDIRRIRASNRSPLTETGTNTYLLGRGDVVVIDPGPALASHRSAILSALDPGEVITGILVTHSHLDHCELARDLAEVANAPVYASGRARTGRSAVMQQLALNGLEDGAESFDASFTPDVLVQDGDVLKLGGCQIEVLGTPGHSGCHVAFANQERIFSGDHVMGWSTSLISPPDGDMADYMNSLQKLALRHWRLALPGHGDQIDDTSARIDALIAHRMSREVAVLGSIASGWAILSDLTPLIYADTPRHLWPAAERNLLAHLIKLWQDGRVLAEPFPGLKARYRAAP